MGQNAKIKKILDQVDLLDELSKIELLSHLVETLKADLRKKASTKSRSITELAGLGAEIWEGVDPDEYLRKERASWE